MFEKLMNKLMDCMDTIGDGIEAGIGSVLGVYHLLLAGDRSWAILTGLCTYIGLLIGGGIIIAANEALMVGGPFAVIVAIAIASKWNVPLLARFGFAAVWAFVSTAVAMLTTVLFLLIIGVISHA